ncbi:hypothetical protein N7488_000785 [Penicillium malachiteum]|nr:hypothetical protein N7488_000785 [Penicillium malachiteum]
MLFHQKWFGVLSLLTSLSAPALADVAEFEELPNANHIFNAIQSTLRHWGSGINSNGMSFFLASVPEGTQFYHGTGAKDPVQGIQWLAFKPEHSLGFAHRSGSRSFAKREASVESSEQQPLGDTEAAIELNAGGYLHTYAAARDLRLLYIDGMSGGPGGGAESQDRILYNDTISSDRGSGSPKIGGPPQESQRAAEACRMAKEDWGGRIDGVVRTEGDFEIIICEFERSLDLVYITQTKPQESSGGPGGPGGHGRRKGGKGGNGAHGTTGGPRPSGDLKSFTARFDERLGQKVRLDFDHFVTAYSYGLDLFPDNAPRPELGHIPLEKLHPIRQDVTNLLKTWDPSLNAFNWQAIADMFVYQYSDVLKTLAAGDFSSSKDLRDQIEKLLEPFIDYRDFEASEVIINRCATEWIPTSAPSNSLGGRAVRSISQRVCSTLTSAMMNKDQDLETATASFKDLISYLRWTTWYVSDSNNAVFTLDV